MPILLMLLACGNGFVAVVQQQPHHHQRSVTRLRSLAAESFSAAVKSEADATKRELAQLREEYGSFLVRSHTERLNLARKSAAKVSELEASAAQVTEELEATRRAFREYLAKSHAARVQAMEMTKKALDSAQSELAEVRAAYAAHLVTSHERNAKMTAEAEARKKELETLSSDFEELKESYGQYVDEMDGLVESQGNELRTARNALAAVAAAVSSVKSPDSAS